MTQGAVHGAWPKKVDASQATASPQGAARADVGPAESVPKTGPKAAARAAPVAPKLQAHAAASIAKPVAPPPLPATHKAASVADDEPTRVAAAPVAALKVPTAPSVATAPFRPQPQPQAAALQYPGEPREDLRPIVRSMVEQATASFDRRIRELQQRIEELENRPAPAPVAIAAPAPQRQYLAPQPITPAGRGLDMAAIDRSVNLDPEMNSLDGRRRRFRLALAVTFACVLVFGGLFAALAQSYTHAHG